MNLSLATLPRMLTTKRDMVRSENPGQQHRRRGICNIELKPLIRSRPWPVRVGREGTLARIRGS